MCDKELERLRKEKERLLNKENLKLEKEMLKNEIMLLKNPIAKEKMKNLNRFLMIIMVLLILSLIVNMAFSSKIFLDNETLSALIIIIFSIIFFTVLWSFAKIFEILETFLVGEEK